MTNPSKPDIDTLATGLADALDEALELPPTPGTVQDAIDRATAEPRYMILCLRRDGNRVILEDHVQAWLHSDFPIAMQLIRQRFSSLIRDPKFHDDKPGAEVKE